MAKRQSRPSALSRIVDSKHDFASPAFCQHHYHTSSLEGLLHQDTEDTRWDPCAGFAECETRSGWKLDWPATVGYCAPSTFDVDSDTQKDLVMISSCMEDRARRASRKRALSSRLASEWSDNQADLYTLDEHDMATLWVANAKAQGQTDEQVIARFEGMVENTSLSLHDGAIELISLYGATAINAGRDGRVLAALGRDLHRSGNVWGSFEIRPHNGRKYIVFKGNHRLRQVIRGTRYTLTNPTVIRLGIGTDGLKAGAKGGVYVTLLISVSVNSYEWIFNEDFGWERFLYNVSADLVKAAISIVLGYFLAKKVLVYTGLVVAANTSGLIVGLATGILVAPVTWSDVGEFAHEAADQYSLMVDQLTNPSALFSATKQRLADIGYCTVDAAGRVVFEAVENEARRRIDGFLRKLSPTNVW